MSLAGTYWVSYSQTGLAEQVGPNGTYSSHQYEDVITGAREGHAVSADIVPGFPIAGSIGRPGWAKCSGQITATFTWMPAYNGEPPPGTVVVRQRSTAIARGDSGSASNGLGDPTVFEAGVWTSTGSRYEVLQSPGESFVRQCTPLANGTVNVAATYPVEGASADVSYQAAALSVQVELNGTFDEGHREATIGQVVSSEFVTNSSIFAPYGMPQYFTTSFSNYSWSVAGDTFESYEADNQNGHVTPFPAAELDDPYPSWCWKGQGDNAVIGGSTLVVDSTFTCNVSGSKTAQVTVPPHLFTYTGTGASNYYPQNSNSPVERITSQVLPNQPAMKFTAAVTGPSFPVPMSRGNWLYTQVVKTVRVVDGGPPVGIRIDTMGFEVLDKSFPYPVFSRPPSEPQLVQADGTTVDTWDTPNNYCNSSLTVADDFKMYILYRPPGGQYAPIAFIPWEWNVSASGSGQWTNWQPQPPGNSTAGNKTLSSMHPVWTHNIQEWIP